MNFTRHLAFTIASVASLSLADHPVPGHSLNGESFNEGPRQRAVLMEGTGKVKFPISTKNPEAQKFFEQGVGQLHGFWYFESERSFRTVASIDPDCAIAYWGMAMSNVNNEKRAKEFVKKAVELKGKASKKDQLWITTLENFYRDDKRDKKQRALDYISDLEAIVHDDPADLEAKAFLVWKTWHARDLAPITSKQAVDALMDQILAKEPNHPVHHYRIHLWDDSKPIRALASAALCGQSAPGIAHMWHMPGHTYSKLRRFDDAAWQQEAATRVDHRQMIDSLVLPDQIHNYAHNEEWLTRTYNELGRARDAMDLAKSLIEIPRHPTHNTLDKGSTSASYGRTRLLDTLLKWELWDQVLTLTNGPYLPTVVQASHEASRLRAMGIARYNKKQPKELALTLASLETLEKKEKNKPKTPAPKPTSEIQKKNPKEEIRKAEPIKPEAKPADTKSKSEPKNDPIREAIKELQALRAILSGEKSAAIKALAESKDIPKERLASYYLRLDDKKKAEELIKNFNQDLAGQALKTEMLIACGKDAEAKKAFEATQKAAFTMDRDLPLSKRLDALASKFEVKGDWHSPAPVRTDSGKRPPLQDLGPMHWHPPTARPWSVLNAEGRPVSDKDFKGKNVLLCLYLGHQCGHCMEQLNAIADVAEQLKSSGIEVAAISLEKPEELTKANEKSKRKGGFPFPLLSDSSLSVFKTYRAIDDFEKTPLHALVLIDASNRIRWLDIGYDPFTQTSFLLEECKRLLKLPAAAASVAAAPSKK
jgi:peroxiredoxin